MSNLPVEMEREIGGFTADEAAKLKYRIWRTEPLIFIAEEVSADASDFVRACVFRLANAIPMSTEKSLVEKILFQSRLLIEEAVINAIGHGSEGDPEKKVSVHFGVSVVEVGSKQKLFLILDVQDQGKPFNIAEIRDPTHEDNLENPHGRGVWLATQLCGAEIDQEPFFEGTGKELKFTWTYDLGPSDAPDRTQS